MSCILQDLIHLCIYLINLYWVLLITKELYVLLLQFTFIELYLSFLAHPLFLNCASQAAFSLSRWSAASTPHRTLAVDVRILVQRQGNILYCVPTAPAQENLHFVVLWLQLYLFAVYCHWLLLELLRINVWVLWSTSLLHSTFPSAITFHSLILKCIWRFKKPCTKPRNISLIIILLPGRFHPILLV